MGVDEASGFFQGVPSLRAKLSWLVDVGLGYLKLGQPGYTLSGGEAQRLKIARELSLGGRTKGPTLFILDEPTTGLHFSEVKKLLTVLRRLIANHHSVIVIEHNLQFISHSDYLIDMGPDGGETGGFVCAVGTPDELVDNPRSIIGQYLRPLRLGETKSSPNPHNLFTEGSST